MSPSAPTSPPSTGATNTRKTRVLVVGGGASGMSAAHALSRHPDQFDVTLYERSSYPGGMATSSPIDKEKYGAEYINDGVQGASPVFHNTYALFEELGFATADVGMQVSFGRDPEMDFWTNVFPSPVVDKFAADIKRFGRVLKVIKMLKPLFAMISVGAMLRMLCFSKDFGDVIVFPLVALFFGTGNQTPFISSAILERVFMDPNMRLFEYSPTTFLATIPRMCAFPKLSMLYMKWKSTIEDQSKGSARIILNREVTLVKRHPPSSSSKSPATNGSVEVWSRATRGTNRHQEVVDPEVEERKEVFDEIIFCTDADAALRILAEDASWLERKILGNVKYLWDVTVTHSDIDYMRKYYRVDFDPELCSRLGGEDRQERFEYAAKNFRPLYFIRSHPDDKSKIEMSFDLTVYQPQFDGVEPDGSRGGEPSEGDSSIPLERHVFQTIFLDKAPESSKLWSKSEINPDKIIMEKWWKQQSHRWQHYGGTVPWMGLINGKRHTHFAGAWTVLNMHEIAIVSGFGAAYQLGASYPFADRPECKRLFALCLAANHMSRMRKEDREGVLL